MVQNVGFTDTWCRILVLVANVQNVGVTGTWCRILILVAHGAEYCLLVPHGA